MKNAVILLLAAMLIFMSSRMIKIENQRYALFVGMCIDKTVPARPLPDLKCLQTVETRTSWMWHLFYALTD